MAKIGRVGRKRKLLAQKVRAPIISNKRKHTDALVGCKVSDPVYQSLAKKYESIIAKAEKVDLSSYSVDEVRRLDISESAKLDMIELINVSKNLKGRLD